MADDGLRQRLVGAVADFPVHGWPADLHRRVIRRQRRLRAAVVTAGVAVVVGVGAAVPLGLGGSLGLGPDGPVPAGATASTTQPALVGGAWLLVLVEDADGTTSIPAEIGARMELTADGRIFVNDGVNTLVGTFTAFPGGFEVSDAVRTLAGYGGTDPAQAAAIASLSQLAFGEPTGALPPPPARDSVVSLDDTGLVVAAGEFRLTFRYAGPAGTLPPPLVSTSR